MKNLSLLHREFSLACILFLFFVFLTYLFVYLFICSFYTNSNGIIQQQQQPHILNVNCECCYNLLLYMIVLEKPCIGLMCAHMYVIPIFLQMDEHIIIAYSSEPYMYKTTHKKKNKNRPKAHTNEL